MATLYIRTEGHNTAVISRERSKDRRMRCQEFSVIVGGARGARGARIIIAFQGGAWTAIVAPFAAWSISISWREGGMIMVGVRAPSTAKVVVRRPKKGAAG